MLLTETLPTFEIILRSNTICSQTVAFQYKATGTDSYHCFKGLTLKKPIPRPHSLFVCIVWISEQTAIISLYSINRLVFITETGLFTARYGLNPYKQFSLTFVFPPMLHTSPTCCSYQKGKQIGEAWEPSKKQCSFANQGALGRKVLSLFSSLKSSS